MAMTSSTGTSAAPVTSTLSIQLLEKDKLRRWEFSAMGLSANILGTSCASSNSWPECDRKVRRSIFGFPKLRRIIQSRVLPASG